MSNSQLLQAVRAEAARIKDDEEWEKKNDPIKFESLRHVFTEALLTSLRETKGEPESHDEFGERAVGNFIIMAGEAGFASVAISDFLESLTPR